MPTKHHPSPGGGAPRLSMPTMPTISQPSSHLHRLVRRVCSLGKCGGGAEGGGCTPSTSTPVIRRLSQKWLLGFSSHNTSHQSQPCVYNASIITRLQCVHHTGVNDASIATAMRRTVTMRIGAAHFPPTHPPTHPPTTQPFGAACHTQRRWLPSSLVRHCFKANLGCALSAPVPGYLDQCNCVVGTILSRRYGGDSAGALPLNRLHSLPHAHSPAHTHAHPCPSQVLLQAPSVHLFVRHWMSFAPGFRSRVRSGRLLRKAAVVWFVGSWPCGCACACGCGRHRRCSHSTKVQSLVHGVQNDMEGGGSPWCVVPPPPPADPAVHVA
jgi:hypothetical protein